MLSILLCKVLHAVGVSGDEAAPSASMMTLLLVLPSSFGDAAGQPGCSPDWAAHGVLVEGDMGDPRQEVVGWLVDWWGEEGAKRARWVATKSFLCVPDMR